jgi:chromosome segregation ATPase
MGMNSTTLGAVMEKEENERAHDEIEQLVTADLISDWKEPSTRGDIRNFAIRMDSQFGKLERQFDKIDGRFDKMDTKFESNDARFESIDARFDKVDAKFDALNARFDTFKAEIITLINTSGLRYIGAMITTNIAMFAIFERFFAS